MTDHNDKNEIVPSPPQELAKLRSNLVRRGIDDLTKLTVSEVDPLLKFKDERTGLVVWEYLWYVLGAEIGRSRRTGSEFSLILIDLNMFKSGLDDCPWDDFRDAPADWLSCLEHVGQALQSTSRRSDTASRIDTARFAILIPGLSERPGETGKLALQTASNLSRKFGEAEWLWFSGRTIKLSASIGVVSFPNDAKTGPELLELALEMVSLVRTSEHGGVAAPNMGILQRERY
jgi:diguanylate cyclase (GGDEF)-like protein